MNGYSISYPDPNPKLSSRRRADMIRYQLANRNITDQRVLKAFDKVKRHDFVSEALYPRAYEDQPLPIGCSQTISQPYISAYMTQELRLEGKERVLEIGTGSGFQCAILAELSKIVVSIEKIEQLYQQAKARLIFQMKYSNIRLIFGNGLTFSDDRQKFDRILYTAGAPFPPKNLVNLIKPGGIILIPIGNQNIQTLCKITSNPGGKKNFPGGDAWPEYPNFFFKRLLSCRFVPLVGPGGWED